ncbi:MAG: hypothetical protein GXN99_01365 [Candidatus Nanohaloarchaeota archaeon]|nr:hypothetical protein [Candidatus Nanohaloarchaeota archaeon]
MGFLGGGSSSTEQSTYYVERVSTGVIGLDDKIEGGLVKGSVNLVVGKAGTGKTQFCSSFIYAGAKNGEPGLYITTEEAVDAIKEDIRAMFNWDFNEMENLGLIRFVSIKPVIPDKSTTMDVTMVTRSYILNVINKISVAVKELGAKRLVIDSISVLEMFIDDKYLARVALMNLTDKLRQLGVTTVMSGEIPETSEGLSGSGIIEYLVDSVIKLDFVPVSEEFKRTLTIRKMRRTNHSTLIHPFEITREGMKLIEI